MSSAFQQAAAQIPRREFIVENCSTSAMWRVAAALAASPECPLRPRCRQGWLSANGGLRISKLPEHLKTSSVSCGSGACVRGNGKLTFAAALAKRSPEGPLTASHLPLNQRWSNVSSGRGARSRQSLMAGRFVIIKRPWSLQASSGC